VADIVRGIGADFCGSAYGDAIEEQQIYGGMLYSLTLEGIPDMNNGKGGRAKAPKRGEGAERLRVISDKQCKTDDYSGLHI
jgi:hypothetical protein